MSSREYQNTSSTGSTQSIEPHLYEVQAVSRVSNPESLGSTSSIRSVEPRNIASTGSTKSIEDRWNTPHISVIHRDTCVVHTP